MMSIFSIQVLIRHLWQLKTAVVLHRCLIRALLFNNVDDNAACFKRQPISQSDNNVIIVFLHH